eukprot:TRINITY_DN9854_c0_g1_i1.p1 TRINITY_DN9854_c0_g1~~TRINITY_DN9854_c0_g1_i1.p1  ORF type:complete len:228 (+),score=97.18 TRINITY_DN9854_c0_g1_i1:37-720(+)
MAGKKKKAGKKGGGKEGGKADVDIDEDALLDQVLESQQAAAADAAVKRPGPDDDDDLGLMEDWPPAGLNQFVTIEEEMGKKHPVRQGTPDQYVEYVQYSSIDELQDIMDMMAADLSEPYPVFTYRYFIDNWPDLCWLARLKSHDDPNFSRIVGAITCKAAMTNKSNDERGVRGYIAMLAVHQEHRKNGFGSKLVTLALDTMKKKGCTEVVLETEISNQGTPCTSVCE